MTQVHDTPNSPRPCVCGHWQRAHEREQGRCEELYCDCWRFNPLEEDEEEETLPPQGK